MMYFSKYLGCLNIECFLIKILPLLKGVSAQ